MEEATRESKLLSEVQGVGAQEMRELKQIKQGMEWPQAELPEIFGMGGNQQCTHASI
jgi:hypothetical protein